MASLLPGHLLADLRQDLNWELVAGCPLFAKCPPAFLRALARYLLFLSLN